jgi:glycosyltransferase involved in cell wall biosynthesis
MARDGASEASVAFRLTNAAASCQLQAAVGDHAKVADALRKYRGCAFPSLAKANGIVVREAMVMGLPVIAQN